MRYHSYLQAGPNFFIEKSKRKMIAEDIAAALALIHVNLQEEWSDKGEFSFIACPTPACCAKKEKPMFYNTVYRGVAILCAALIAGCISVQSEPASSPAPAISETAPILPTSSMVPSTIPARPSLTFNLAHYAFPDSIDPAEQYLFYLHGKIIEDQGIPATNPEYGEYEYGAILEELSGYGFHVISEQRPKDTDGGVEYARKVTRQVQTLLDAGVPAKNITVVGASKGAGITILVSHFLANSELNYVILAICHPNEVEHLMQNQIFLHGNILSIYDSVDQYAGSCQGLFSFSEGKGISRHEEIVLNIGTGHGILYQPLDEWVIPAVQWAGTP